jgi:hypothetical protein
MTGGSGGGGISDRLQRPVVPLTFRRWLWLRLMSRNDLNMVHVALRLALEHPGFAAAPESMAFEDLADRLWAESVRRPN